MEHDMSDSNFLLEQLRSDVGGMEQEQLRRRRRSRSLSFPQVRFGHDSYGCWKVLSEFLLLAAPIKFWGCCCGRHFSSSQFCHRLHLSSHVSIYTIHQWSISDLVSLFLIYLVVLSLTVFFLRCIHGAKTIKKRKTRLKTNLAQTQHATARAYVNIISEHRL